MHAVLLVPQLSSSHKKCLPVMEKSCTDARAAVRIWDTFPACPKSVTARAFLLIRVREAKVCLVGLVCMRKELDGEQIMENQSTWTK